jgi:hypothetical protein
MSNSIQRTPYVPYSGSVPSNNNAKEVEVSIELLSNPITLKISLNKTVEDIKEKIRSETKMDQDEKIDLLLEGQTLEDDRTLASYNITEDSVLFQAAKNSAERGNKCISFGIKFNALEENDIKHVEIAKEGPKHRTIIPGLNLRGICDNKTCKALNQVVWIQKGMGTFDIPVEVYTSNCPSCNQTANKIDNLGFFNCLYSISGFQTQPEKKKVEKNDIVADDKDFTTFDQTKELAHWVKLTITTKPRKK